MTPAAETALESSVGEESRDPLIEDDKRNPRIKCFDGWMGRWAIEQLIDAVRGQVFDGANQVELACVFPPVPSPNSSGEPS